MIKKHGKLFLSITLVLLILFPVIRPVDALAAIGFDESTELKLNQLTEGNLITDNDRNYFKFTTTSNDSFYKIELRNTEANDDIELSVCSSNDNTTKEFSISADTEEVSMITRKLDTNHTYYVVVEPEKYSYTKGKFKVCVTEIKDDIPDSFENSKNIGLNKKLTYSLDDSSDVDCYKFTTSSNDSFYNIELSNSEADGDIKTVLYSENDITTKVFDFSTDVSEKNYYSIKLEQNHTYYLIVKSDDYDNADGKYKILVNEIKDDATDSFNKCAKLKINKKNTFKIDVSNDEDFFKFNVSKKGDYSITASNNCSDTIFVTVYSENDITQKMDRISAYYKEMDTHILRLKPKHTYYISATSYKTGSYSITIKPNK